MKTDDIQCESSINGYNSSIIIWRMSFGSAIFEYMNKFDKFITKQLVRFDHYLELLVKNADFIQDLYKGKVLDYNSHCKNKEQIPENCSIIAFPRNPKPHQCSETWIFLFWK